MHESRIFKMIYYLLEHGEATACELAEQFEVSIRTVYRDIDVMSSVGVPIYTMAGRHGGIKLYDDYVLNKALLSKKDMQNILIGVESLSAIPYLEYDHTLMKLKATFQMLNNNWIEVDFSRWGSQPSEEKQVFVLLKKAILNQLEVRFCYYNSSGIMSQRCCQPLKLIYKDKSWYLFGYCLNKSDYRLFRITRIKELQLTDVKFDLLLDNNISIFPQSVDIAPVIEVEFHFPLAVGYRIFDIFTQESITKKDSMFVVKTMIPHNEWLYEMIMSFGSQIDIIKPFSLKQEIINRYEKTLHHLKEKTDEY